jgi:AraC-like DNA-binding protein
MARSATTAPASATPGASERLYLHLDGDVPCGPETTVPVDTLAGFAVARPLDDHVAQIGVYREAIPAGREVLERVLPDGAVHLVFSLGDPPSVDGQRGRPMEVVGPSSAPVVLRMAGRMHGLSVALRPGAVAGLLGVPAGALAERTVELAELWPDAATSALFDRLVGAPDDATRVALLQDALTRRLARVGAGAPVHAAVYAARLIARSGGQLTLRDAAAAVGVGERRLQQLFHAHVGLSPRTWGRLARMHACLRALRGQHAPAWAQVAAQAGFYDQSHLINEFQALCGLTPRLFLEQATSGSSKTGDGPASTVRSP